MCIYDNLCLDFFVTLREKKTNSLKYIKDIQILNFYEFSMFFTILLDIF